jgi:hypothetical protein
MKENLKLQASTSVALIDSHLMHEAIAMLRHDFI